MFIKNLQADRAAAGNKSTYIHTHSHRERERETSCGKNNKQIA